MKTTPKKIKTPTISDFDRWRSRVSAYCHECWGRGGFECLTDKRWRQLYDSEVRPDLSEYEFATAVVLQWVAHHYWHKDKDTLRKPASFATRKAVRAVHRQWTEQNDRTEQFRKAREIAHRVAVPDAPKTPPEPPPQEDAGKWEQPARVRNPRLRRMLCKSGVCPVPLRGYKYKDIIAWVEAVTDMLEKVGEFPTIGCLQRWVHDTVPDRDEAVLVSRRISAAYYEEVQQEIEYDRRFFARSFAHTEPAKPEPKKAKPAKPAAKVEERSAVVTVSEVNGQKKYRVFGHPVTAVLRWMGKDAWTFAEARTAMTKLGIPEVKDNTLKAQLMTGRKGDGYGGRKPAAALTPEQQETLYALLEKTDGKGAKADRSGEARRPEQQAAQRGRKAKGKAQAPAGPVRTWSGDDKKNPPIGPHPNTTRPRVRPADEPAGRSGRTGRPDPGEKDRKKGVGGVRQGRVPTSGTPVGRPAGAGGKDRGRGVPDDRRGRRVPPTGPGVKGKPVNPPAGRAGTR